MHEITTVWVKWSDLSSTRIIEPRPSPLADGDVPARAEAGCATWFDLLNNKVSARRGILISI